jgi:hypothetical protein
VRGETSDVRCESGDDSRDPRSLFRVVLLHGSKISVAAVKKIL